MTTKQFCFSLINLDRSIALTNLASYCSIKSVNVLTRESYFALTSSDRATANVFASIMRSFSNGVFDFIKSEFGDQQQRIRPRVHYIWNSVRRKSWASKITMAWALYAISDVIRVYTYYPKKESFEFPLEYGWVLSIKTLRVSQNANTMRVVMPKGSIHLNDFCPFYSSDIWLGAGRVFVYDDCLRFSLEVINESMDS